MQCESELNPTSCPIMRSDLYVLFAALNLTFSWTTVPIPGLTTQRPRASSASTSPRGSKRFIQLHLVCFSDRLVFELGVGHQCKDIKREQNRVCKNRNVSGICAYWDVIWLYQEDALITDGALSGHLLQATGTDGPSLPPEATQEHDCVEVE